ncbi:hypothetical protein FIBSPDRAFT_448973 [Athelia psychrophila]|uniref:Uncharacterized protein n=1 Tax=Athelia psychrophila TaxID=1759441 RepID=A0A167UEZ9_9AGAM|nr:hypothetical protein FIBSPDRAFT_448973 [Fibularhizoctonia sp. CBS 109695]
MPRGIGVTLLGLMDSIRASYPMYLVSGGICLTMIWTAIVVVVRKEDRIIGALCNEAVSKSSHVDFALLLLTFSLRRQTIVYPFLFLFRSILLHFFFVTTSRQKKHQKLLDHDTLRLHSQNGSATPPDAAAASATKRQRLSSAHSF